MRIAVVNEVSACKQNGDIIKSLEGRGHEVINAGMKSPDETPELTYVHTGLLAGLLLNTGTVDFVVGGCGTGQGFMTSVMQYPNVVCGLTATPLEAWLFAQINGGNCVSLPLLYNYGWAGDVNLKNIFDSLFSVEFGQGYPEHRKESQQKSRKMLFRISSLTHRSFAEIIDQLDDEVVKPVLTFPSVLDIINVDGLTDEKLKASILNRV
ncbi:MAG: RpiB/LacA/LacB family sugar-phosphate isomerase [Spirochaetota bacterium]